VLSVKAGLTCISQIVLRSMAMLLLQNIHFKTM